MNRQQIENARNELESIIRDAWGICAQTGDPRDEAMARATEADARALLAQLPARRMKRKKSKAARKRAALHGCTRLDAHAPILPQVRALAR